VQGFGEKLEEKRSLPVNMIILKQVFKKWDEAWTGLIWHKIRTGGRRL
jgi:hypothetical protein